MAIHSIDNKTTSVQDLAQTTREGLGTVSISPVIEGQAQGYITIKDAQIIVNDGTNDRIVIGFQENGF